MPNLTSRPNFATIKQYIDIAQRNYLLKEASSSANIHTLLTRTTQYIHELGHFLTAEEKNQLQDSTNALNNLLQNKIGTNINKMQAGIETTRLYHNAVSIILDPSVSDAIRNNQSVLLRKQANKSKLDRETTNAFIENLNTLNQLAAEYKNTLHIEAMQFRLINAEKIALETQKLLNQPLSLDIDELFNSSKQCISQLDNIIELKDKLKLFEEIDTLNCVIKNDISHHAKHIPLAIKTAQQLYRTTLTLSDPSQSYENCQQSIIEFQKISRNTKLSNKAFTAATLIKNCFIALLVALVVSALIFAPIVGVLSLFGGVVTMAELAQLYLITTVPFGGALGLMAGIVAICKPMVNAFRTNDTVNQLHDLNNVIPKNYFNAPTSLFNSMNNQNRSIKPEAGLNQNRMGSQWQ